jgi:hypothetical protein
MPREAATHDRGGPASRTSLIWVLAGVFMVVSMSAAASGPVQVWTDPETDVSSPSIAGGDAVEPVAPPAPEPGAPVELPWVRGLLNTLAGLVILVLIGGGVILALTELRPSLWAGRFHRRWRTSEDFDVLPDVFETSLNVDVEAAHAALAQGRPRNAIVACWMQLERDAAEVGLPRLEAETPTEYVERVVAASSVEPRPIGELASLYREARFSRHELGELHRERAVRALNGVVAALRDRADVSR